MESPPNTGSGSSSPRLRRKLLAWVLAGLAANFVVSGAGALYVLHLFRSQQLSHDQAMTWGIALVATGPLVGGAIIVVGALRVLRGARAAPEKPSSR